MDWTALLSWSEANEPSEVLSQASIELPYELEEIPNPPNYPMTKSLSLIHISLPYGG